MGLSLIAMGWGDLSLWIAVLKVAIGLGMVIFVHELGHFAVAKMCGVKCEKFYLGFDIAGLKFCKFTWGETEYGVGILPLGGYVKMLGQEDNPARLKQEIERARLKQAADGAPQTQAEETQRRKTDEIDAEAARHALFDPRSYLAKSVPKRMAIISAGVIMNLVFAFVTAVIAFELGVRRLECGVGGLMPGQAAWQEGFKVGDKISKVAGQDIETFRDMKEAISLGDNLQEGVAIEVDRPGKGRLPPLTVKPDSSGLLPMIGIFNPRTTTLFKEELPVHPGSAAAKCSPSFEPGDKIVSIDGETIENYAQIHAYLALHPDKTLKVTLERGVSIEVAPNPMRRLGLVMEMGEICAIRAGSPAETAETPGIEVGDLIRRIDGRPAGDPLTLPDRLRRRAGETITLTVEREVEKGRERTAKAALARTTSWAASIATGPEHRAPVGVLSVLLQPQRELIDVEVTLGPADSYEVPMAEGSPMTAPALGIAYRVSNRVGAVEGGSRAREAGVHQGDVVVEATLLPPDPETLKQYGAEQEEETLEFDAQRQNWPVFMAALQRSLPGTRVRLKCVRRTETYDATLTTTLEPVESKRWFDPDRGFIFEPAGFDQKAETLGQAVRWGAEETLDSTLLVYRFLRKLGTQVSFKALGGPVAIFTVAKRAAERSTSDLLIFLTLLSANLAVINFLPIPLLDGGHMLLLAWEGIRGKPADERVQSVLAYIGFILILTLMAWVIGLDFFRLTSGF